MMRYFAGILAGVLAMALLLPATASAAWQGEIKSGEGTITVTNPESPAEGETRIQLHELWRVGGDDEDFLFGVISQLLHDDEGNIYLLDGQLSVIQIFAPDGTFVRTIGREGEGPSEFQNGADMYWAPGGELAVMQAWPGKIVQIQTDGQPGGPFKLPYRDGGGLQVASRGMGLGDRIVLSGSAWTTEEGEQKQISYLKAYDATGKELAHYHEHAREQRFGGWEFQEEKFSDFQRRWTAAPDGRVAAALSFDEYRIHVWNPDGSLDRIIERPDYRPVQRTSAEKKRFQMLYDAVTQWNPNSTFRVSDDHATVGQMHFREDGSLWVQSSQDMWRAAADEYTSFDIYDQEGRFVQRAHLVADADAVEDGLFFAGNRAYVVTDLFSAAMASLGGDETESGSLDPEPVSVIAFAFTPPQIEVSRAK